MASTNPSAEQLVDRLQLALSDWDTKSHVERTIIFETVLEDLEDLKSCIQEMERVYHVRKHDVPPKLAEQALRRALIEILDERYEEIFVGYESRLLQWMETETERRASLRARN